MLDWILAGQPFGKDKRGALWRLNFMNVIPEFFDNRWIYSYNPSYLPASVFTIVRLADCK